MITNGITLSQGTTIYAFIIVGASCRFASTTDNQGPCIFPCRCTKGCDNATGECLNGGTCIDGHPSGYRWGGTACQSGRYIICTVFYLRYIRYVLILCVMQPNAGTHARTHARKHARMTDTLKLFVLLGIILNKPKLYPNI